MVVFHHPVSGEDYIKRLIGLPGDTVQMRHGLLYLNGTPVEVQPAGTFAEPMQPQGPVGTFPRCQNAPVERGGACTKTRDRETLPNGMTHDILNIVDDGPADNTEVFTVPPGEYFFMGDNRDNSEDSRFPQPQGVGFVPFENLIGRADRVMFSSAGRSLFDLWHWRWGRLMQAIE